MNSPIARLRFRGQHSEHQKPAQPATAPAYSRLPAGPQGRLAVAEPLFPPEPVKLVQCGFCRGLGLSSEIPGIGGGEYRCSGIDGCVQRYLSGPGAKLHPGPDAGPALPEAQEEALAAFNEAHDEQDALEAGPGTGDQDVPEGAEEPAGDAETGSEEEEPGDAEPAEGGAAGDA